MNTPSTIIHNSLQVGKLQLSYQLTDGHMRVGCPRNGIAFCNTKVCDTEARYNVHGPEHYPERKEPRYERPNIAWFHYVKCPELANV